MPAASPYALVSRLVPSLPCVAWAGLPSRVAWAGLPSPVWPGRAFSPLCGLGRPSPTSNLGGFKCTRILKTGMQFWLERQPHVSICHNLAFRQEATACLSPSCNLAVFTKALKCDSCGHIHGRHVFEKQNTCVLICPAFLLTGMGVHMPTLPARDLKGASREVTGGKKTPTPSLDQARVRGQNHRQGFQGLMG